MKWLLLAVALVLTSPFSTAGWETCATPKVSNDSPLIVALDCYEFTTTDADVDNDDIDRVSIVFFAGRAVIAHLRLAEFNCRSQAWCGHAIRAPPRY